MQHQFEDDPRLPKQLERDLDSMDVTISMYAVEDHEGTRSSQSVFRAESSDWNAVKGTFRQFRTETGFSSCGMPSYEDAGHVWLVSDTWSGSGILRVAGPPKSIPGMMRFSWPVSGSIPCAAVPNRGMRSDSPSASVRSTGP